MIKSPSPNGLDWSVKLKMFAHLFWLSFRRRLLLLQNSALLNEVQLTHKVVLRLQSCLEWASHQSHICRLLSPALAQFPFNLVAQSFSLPLKFLPQKGLVLAPLRHQCCKFGPHFFDRLRFWVRVRVTLHPFQNSHLSLESLNLLRPGLSQKSRHLSRWPCFPQNRQFLRLKSLVWLLVFLLNVISTAIFSEGKISKGGVHLRRFHSACLDFLGCS